MIHGNFRASIVSAAFALLFFMGAPAAMADYGYFSQGVDDVQGSVNMFSMTTDVPFVSYTATSGGTVDGNFWIATYGVSGGGFGYQPFAIEVIKNGSLQQQCLSTNMGYTGGASGVDGLFWGHCSTLSGFSVSPGDVIELAVNHSGSFGTDIRITGASTTIPNLTCENGFCPPPESPAFQLGGTSQPSPSPTDTSTRIIDFTPEDATTTSNPVSFSLHAYINPADVGASYQIAFTLHNIDQNVLLLSFLSPSDIYFLQNVVATTSGDFYYSTTTTIGEGNYRINAILQKNILWGWLKDPFASVNENLSHQFVVGSPTLIGSLTQNGFSELNGYLASSTATSSIALIESNCNPLSGFSMTGCLTGLFVPDTQALNTTITGFQQGVLQRAPWGYFTRIYAILSSTTTAALPSYTVNVALNNASDTTTLTFNPGDMIAGAGALLASTTDPYDHKNLRDIAEPVVQLVIALGVVLTIFADLTGSHRHQSAESVRMKRA